MSERDSMSESDELAKIIQREYTRAIARSRMSDAYTAPADAILAAGYGRRFPNGTCGAGMSEREVVRRLLVDYIGECACDEAYTMRGLRDPQCNYHDVMLEDLLEDLMKLGAKDV